MTLIYQKHMMLCSTSAGDLCEHRFQKKSFMSLASKLATAVLEIIVLEPQVQGVARQCSMLSLRSVAGLSSL